jgi:hypothetical protein
MPGSPIRCYVRQVTAWHVRGIVLPESVERGLFIVDGRLQVEPVEGASTVATDLFLLPGLVDVHAHLALASPAGDGATPHERVRASARAHLDTGVLALREPGSVDHASYGLGPDEGLPRVTTAGRFLAPPGRYFPGRYFPGRYFPGLANEVTDLDLPEAALRVHEAGGRMAMHCGLPEVIQTAIEAGVDSLSTPPSCNPTKCRRWPPQEPRGFDPVDRGGDPLDVAACGRSRPGPHPRGRRRSR